MNLLERWVFSLRYKALRKKIDLVDNILLSKEQLELTLLILKRHKYSKYLDTKTRGLLFRLCADIKKDWDVVNITYSGGCISITYCVLRKFKTFTLESNTFIQDFNSEIIVRLHIASLLASKTAVAGEVNFSQLVDFNKYKDTSKKSIPIDTYGAIKTLKGKSLTITYVDGLTKGITINHVER
jgi:hypothetical protein